jgi:hypothetical protein
MRKIEVPIMVDDHSFRVVAGPDDLDRLDRVIGRQLSRERNRRAGGEREREKCGATVHRGWFPL